MDASGWFSGDNFHLNRIRYVELSEEFLSQEEVQQLEEADSHEDPATRWHVMEVPLSDERCGLDERINRGAIGLEDLNATGSATAVLVTTFDWPSPADIPWFKDQLHLSRHVEVTLCAHLWPQMQAARCNLWQELTKCFQTPVLHFTGTPGFSQPGAVEPMDEPEWVTSVHGKLMLLEFPDRLRVVIGSANLQHRFWEVNNEVLWVKDFPRAADGNQLQRLLASDFSTVFSHFLVQILQEAPLQRLNTWLVRLLSFDLTCDVRLVASLPGEYLPARALQANQLVLRLSLDQEDLEDADPHVMLKRMVDPETSAAKWFLVGQEGQELGRLDEMSLRALKAAEDLNFMAYRGEHEVSLATASEINVERTTLLAEGSQPVTKLRVLLRESMERQLSQLSREELTGIASLLALLEVDYGLFALRRHLADDLWPREAHYVALSGSVASLEDWWLRDWDRCCGRQAEEPGPQLLVPRDRPRVPSGYRPIHEAMPGKLVEHLSPAAALGRQRVRNHSKLLTRICADEAGQRCGWIYVGSHNFTKSAWGSIWRHEMNEMDDGQEVLSVSNRELGVLLIQPPGSESQLLSNAPWPFGFPLTPVQEEDLDFESEDESDPAAWGQQWNWWNWYDNSTWTWDEDDQEMWEEEYRERWQDWSLRQKNWWWWATA